MVEADGIVFVFCQLLLHISDNLCVVVVEVFVFIILFEIFKNGVNHQQNVIVVVFCDVWALNVGFNVVNSLIFVKFIV